MIEMPDAVYLWTHNMPRMLVTFETLIMWRDPGADADKDMRSYDISCEERAANWQGNQNT